MLRQVDGSFLRISFETQLSIYIIRSRYRFPRAHAYYVCPAAQSDLGSSGRSYSDDVGRAAVACPITAVLEQRQG